MIRLLTLLVTKGEPPWWRLRESAGDPPEEREYMYTWTALLQIIRHKLAQTKENEHHEIDS